MIDVSYQTGRKVVAPMSRSSPNLEDIVSKLMELIIERGFHSATPAMLRRKTGLEKTALAHIFRGGKKQVAKEIIEQCFKIFRRDLFSILESERSPKEVLSELFQNLPTDKTGQALEALFVLGSQTHYFSEDVQAFPQLFQRSLVKCLRRVQVSKKKAASLALDISTSLQGALALKQIYRDQEAYELFIIQLEKRILSSF